MATLTNRTATSFLAALTFLGVICFFAPAFAQTRCLDYWSAGPAKCRPQQPEKTEAPTQKPKQILPPTVVVRPAPPKPEKPLSEKEQKESQLQQDIEKFYDRHGKPPEEFVRFYMDPSPENALAWVKKYNESILRSRQLAAAWTQAQKVYDEFEKQGIGLPQELLPEYTKDPTHQLPPVQDLGIPIEGENVFAPPQNQQPLANAGQPSLFGLGNAPAAPPFGGQPLGGQALGGQPLGGGLSVVASNGSLTANLPPEALTNNPFKPASVNTASAGGGAPLKISYYFSAECPFCKKFEPGLKNVIKELGNTAEVTCVDMTPSGQTQANIYGKLDCAWRPLEPGEMRALGIEATPTLIVDRGADKPLERLSGFVDEQKLRSYLIK